ncbi:hypothetical protein PIB30_047617 [Stylosanthes scabra]|uniref:Aminotransferase-like plant mobile domain-containing protein n=1 Tax=Stylosanthes scabra TaxID=79078 RepID=A0ABU6RGU9_9FABA|nr:hypothetical protein [Stylosanthes scabra]
MAPRGRSRRHAREDSRGEQANQAGSAAQAGPVPQEKEDLHRLNRVWHIAGALRERILLLRRCSFLMPILDRLMPFMMEAGFGHAIQLRDFVFETPLISAFVERWRPESHTFHLSWG